LLNSKLETILSLGYTIRDQFEFPTHAMTKAYFSFF